MYITTNSTAHSGTSTHRHTHTNTHIFTHRNVDVGGTSVGNILACHISRAILKYYLLSVYLQLAQRAHNFTHGRRKRMTRSGLMSRRPHSTAHISHGIIAFLPTSIQSDGLVIVYHGDIYKKDADDYVIVFVDDQISIYIFFLASRL